MARSDKDKDKEREEDNEDDKKDGKIVDFVKKNLTKGEMALKHAAGLGHQPNVIPVTKPRVKCDPRPVEVGWHPVGGAAGDWFAEKTSLGKLITERTNKYPDPTQHWAVLVGDYAHQLWMDENFDVIYINEKYKREDWKMFSVGETRFNDDALRRAGEHVINTIREKQPAYNLITNNCQTYALQLLDAIKVGSHKEFGTTLAVYDRILGPGSVAELFAKGEMQQDGEQAGPEGEDTVNIAQHVMDANTTTLDAEEEVKKNEGKKKHRKFLKGRKDDDEKNREVDGGEEEEKEEKKKGGLFAKLKSLR